MHDRHLRLGFQGFFQRLDGEVEPAAPFVAPGEGQADVHVLRLVLGRFPQGRNGVGEPLHRSQCLAAEEQNLGLHAARVVDPLQRLHRPRGERVPYLGRARPPLAIERDQLQIAFGLPKELLAADAIGIGHGSAHQ